MQNAIETVTKWASTKRIEINFLFQFKKMKSKYIVFHGEKQNTWLIIILIKKQSEFYEKRWDLFIFSLIQLYWNRFLVDEQNICKCVDTQQMIADADCMKIVRSFNFFPKAL